MFQTALSAIHREAMKDLDFLAECSQARKAILHALELDDFELDGFELDGLKD